MNGRELFHAIMSYGDFDRLPVIHWGAWPETRERWIAEGMPADADERTFFGAVKKWVTIGKELLELRPPFEERVLEETARHRLVAGADGVIRKEWKARSGIPQFVGFTFRTAADWPEYKRRLQPDPGRLPADLDAQIAAAERSGLPVAIRMASLMGWLRNWMGLENLSYLVHDDPKVFADAVQTLADLSCWSIDQIVPRMASTPDLAVGWEDICFRGGPLISPSIVRDHAASGYAQVRRKLDEHRIPFMAVDCDGFIEPLLPIWLDAGVNLLYPIEIGAWNADPALLRRRFGRGLHMVGGFNKQALAQGQAAIDAEIERRLPLQREGGYILMPDHHVPPQVPLANYRYYLDRVRALGPDQIM